MKLTQAEGENVLTRFAIYWRNGCLIVLLSFSPRFALLLCIRTMLADIALRTILSEHKLQILHGVSVNCRGYWQYLVPCFFTDTPGGAALQARRLVYKTSEAPTCEITNAKESVGFTSILQKSEDVRLLSHRSEVSHDRSEDLINTFL